MPILYFWKTEVNMSIENVIWREGSKILLRYRVVIQ